MKILLAISETPPLHSGIARIAGRLRSGLTAAGHEVDVLSIADTGRLSLGEVRLTGLVPRWPALRTRIDAADIVSVFGPAPTFSDALLLLLWLRRRRASQRIIYTHVFDIDLPLVGPLCAAYNWAHRRLARVADCVILPTPSYAASFASVVPAGRLAVVPWGVDGPVGAISATDKAEQFTVLFVGQLRPYKGVETLIRAAARVPEARVIIAGDGPQRDRLLRQATAAGARNVIFAGAVPDEELARLYRIAHVVALPSVSRMEAFGITLVEGMRAGCVPVASALPGVTDVAGEAGLTFPPGDARTLAGILAWLSHDRAEWRRRSERAARESLQYGWDRTVRGYLAVYESLATAPTAGNAPVEVADAADELTSALRSQP